MLYLPATTEHTYSLAVMPPPEVMADVARSKQRLAASIGWFNSKNAEAHVTLAGFTAARKQLSRTLTFTEAFCRGAAVFESRFDRFGTFSNGAFFFAPDPVSRFRLASLMQAFNGGLPLPVSGPFEPHMTIARRLDPPKLSKATILFKEPVALSFRVDAIALRRLNRKRGQYEVIQRFAFSTKSYQPRPDGAVQIELFG